MSGEDGLTSYQWLPIAVGFAVAYFATVMAIWARFAVLDRTEPRPKALPTIIDLFLTYPALAWLWSDRHRQLGDGWVSRMVMLFRLLTVALGATVVAGILAGG